MCKIVAYHIIINGTYNYNCIRFKTIAVRYPLSSSSKFRYNVDIKITYACVLLTKRTSGEFSRTDRHRSLLCARRGLLYKSSISCLLSYYRYSSDFPVFTQAIAHHDPLSLLLADASSPPIISHLARDRSTKTSRARPPAICSIRART